MLAVLLPAYNEAQNLEPLLKRIMRFCTGNGIQYHVVVVNDGSSDGTLGVAKAFDGHKTVINHERNQGYSKSVFDGIAHCINTFSDDDVLILMDADNTHPPELFTSILKSIASHDIVIASRFQKGATTRGVPFKRKVLSICINLFMRYFFSIKGVRDYTSGYRAYRIGLLRKAYKKHSGRLIESKSFLATLELLIKLNEFRPKVCEVPLDLRYDLKGGKSKINLSGTIREYIKFIIKNI